MHPAFRRLHPSEASTLNFCPSTCSCKPLAELSTMPCRPYSVIYGHGTALQHLWQNTMVSMEDQPLKDDPIRAACSSGQAPAQQSSRCLSTSLRFEALMIILSTPSTSLK